MRTRRRTICSSRWPRAFDKIQERLDAAPSDALASDLKGIKAQVARLAEVPADSERINKRLAEVDGRLQAVGREADEACTLARAAGDAAKVAALETQIKSLRDEIAKLRDAAPKTVPVRVAVAADLAPAVKLLRDRQFAGASAAFRAPDRFASRRRPRVVLCGAGQRLRDRPVARRDRGAGEQGRRPRARRHSGRRRVIDAAFAEILPPGPGRDWLSFYRQRAAAKP